MLSLIEQVKELGFLRTESLHGAFKLGVTFLVFCFNFLKKFYIHKKIVKPEQSS